MNDPHDNAQADRAVLLELMARAFDAAGGEPPEAIRSAVGRDDAVKLRMNSLMRGRIEPATDADRAALAILQPGPDDGEPVTAEDRAAMEACPTCGGAKQLECPTCDGFDMSCGKCWQTGFVDCPPAPDGCGGTGKRGGR